MDHAFWHCLLDFHASGAGCDCLRDYHYGYRRDSHIDYCIHVVAAAVADDCCSSDYSDVDFDSISDKKIIKLFIHPVT